MPGESENVPCTDTYAWIATTRTTAGAAIPLRSNIASAPPWWLR
jgi:hypothetical protein